MPSPRALPTSLVVIALLSATTGASGRQTSNQILTSITRESVILAAERLIVDRTYPPRPNDPGIGLPLDVRILQLAEQSRFPILREEFVRALGRFENPAEVVAISQHVFDIDPGVRDASARALVQALVHATQAEDALAIERAFSVLRGRIDEVSLQSVGELPLNSVQVAEAMKVYGVLIKNSPPSTPAMRGLAALARHIPDLPIPADVRARLRLLAVPHFGPDGGSPVLEALEALSAIHDYDERTIINAAAYRCAGAPEKCWQHRYLAVQMMNGSAPIFARPLHDALRDASYRVRLAALGVAARAIPETKTCGPLLEALDDLTLNVAMRAIDLMNPKCEEREQAATRLLASATELADAQNNARWHVPARALDALAKFLPDDARRISNETAAAHDVWQVRAAAARVAGVLKDEKLALRLMKDAEPNVRTEALQSLGRMQSAALVSAAVDSLRSEDYQLVLFAAALLKKTDLGKARGEEMATSGAAPLMAALERLTAEDKETSRDPSVQLLARIGEYGDPSDGDFVAAVKTYLKDVDPVVAAAAADAIEALTGIRPDPNPTRRPLVQPTETELAAIRTPPPGRTMNAQIWLSDGIVIEFLLLPEQAPLTVYRFKKAADAGYYRNRTFHRLVPDLVIQGGSPGANEYSGAARFWRDEIGAPHKAGAVGVSTRGRHTGDAQVFIDLVDAPQFDHEYTVFGSGACVPSQVLEGAVITNVVAFSPRAFPPVCR